MRRIFAHVDVVLKSEHRWVQLTGFLKRQKAARRFIPRWVIGSKLANRTIGYIAAKLDGLRSGHRNKSPRAIARRKNVGVPTMIFLVVGVTGPREGSCIG
ncbi:MAG TPA: hypothetical protein VMT12_13110 [Syntrophales bacterium]|nr:hypothetical protein [Syntrophales bacterium]